MCFHLFGYKVTTVTANVHARLALVIAVIICRINNKNKATQITSTLSVDMNVHFSLLFSKCFFYARSNHLSSED